MNQEYLNKLFGYKHLPEILQGISKPFYDLAMQLEETLPDNTQKIHVFTKLWEAKNCAVMSHLVK